MPRAQIKKYYAEGKLATEKEIAEFSVSFVVSEELVKNYMDHLNNYPIAKIYELRKLLTRGAREHLRAMDITIGRSFF